MGKLRPRKLKKLESLSKPTALRLESGLPGVSMDPSELGSRGGDGCEPPSDRRILQGVEFRSREQGAEGGLVLG